MPADLPVIDDTACSLGRLTCAECQACADACPTGALSADDAGLALEPPACTACGACVAACPQRAVSLPGLLPLPPPAPDRGGAVALVCPAHSAGGALCLQSLGLEALAALWLDGVRELVLATADCAICASGSGLRFRDHLAAVNQLLAERGHGPISTRTARPRDLRQMPILAAPQDRPDPARRAFFAGPAPVRTADTPPDTTTLARLQAMPPTCAAPRFAFSPAIDAAGCTGCNACVNICPEAALSLIKADGEEFAYHSDAARCSGCQLCVQICEEGAILVEPFAVEMTALPLAAFRCRGCGVSAQVPPARLRDDGLCPVCARTRHHSKLFQVFE